MTRRRLARCRRGPGRGPPNLQARSCMLGDVWGRMHFKNHFNGSDKVRLGITGCRHASSEINNPGYSNL